MPFDGAIGLTLQGDGQPQGLPQLNRLSRWAPNIAMVVETGPGQAVNFATGLKLPVLGTAPVSLLNKGGRALNSTSTGRFDLPLNGRTLFNGAAVTGGFSLVAQWQSGTANARLIEFYTSSAKTTSSGRIYYSSNNINFQIDGSGGSPQWTSAASSFPANTLNTLVLRWDGGISQSSSVVAYINGQPVVFTRDASVIGTARDIGHAVFLNRDDGTRPLNGACNFLWLDNRQRSISDLLYLSVNSYACFESPLPYWGSVIAGGSGNYTSALTLGMTLGLTDNTSLAAVGSMPLGMTMGMSDGNSMAAVAALTIGLNTGLTGGSANALAGALAIGTTLGLADGETVAINAAAALGVNLGLTPADILSIQSALALGVTTGLAMAQGSASNYSASLALGVTMGLADNAIMSALGGLSLGLGLTITDVATNAATGSLSLGVTVGAGVNAGQSFQVNLPIALIAGMQIGAGADFGASVALGFTLGNVISQFVGPLSPPTERIISVQGENRVLVISREGRAINVSLENRILSVKPE
jgi:hypothetical protein